LPAYLSPSNNKNKLAPFLDLFLLLWPGSWKAQLKQMNNLIEKERRNKTKNGKTPKKVVEVTPNEFFVFLGIMISAGPSGKGGRLLFQDDQSVHKTGHHNLLHVINFGHYMKQTWFDDIRCRFHFALFDLQKSDPSLASFDPWYPVVKLVEEFNKNRSRVVAASRIKVQDESMSAWKPRKDKNGGLPNISFIKRKPKPLGTEFKSVACGKTGIMLQLEIQRGKNEMPLRSKYFREHGATSSCALRAAHDTANCGQRDDVHQPNIFYGDSWFASVKTAV
jgi:Transposase IS4